MTATLQAGRSGGEDQGARSRHYCCSESRAVSLGGIDPGYGDWNRKI
ncbi:hypothetical protein [Leptolyngbya sp. PL-A3]